MVLLANSIFSYFLYECTVGIHVLYAYYFLALLIGGSQPSGHGLVAPVKSVML